MSVLLHPITVTAHGMTSDCSYGFDDELDALLKVRELRRTNPSLRVSMRWLPAEPLLPAWHPLTKNDDPPPKE